MIGERLPGVRKIGAVRANALGDLIFILPALASVKAAYPEAELVLLAREWHAAFLNERPSPVDRVIVLPPIRGLSAPDSDESAPAQTPAWLREQLQCEGFDLLLQMHGGGKRSNPFLKEIGAPPIDVMPRIGVTARDVQEALSQLGEMPRKPLVVLHPGATDPRRRWSSKKYAMLGDALYDRGAAIAITGDLAESTIVDEVAERMRAPAHTFAGTLSLGGLAGLLHVASVVIGNDTGPLHLARAVETPTVTLYWIGNAINGGPLFQHAHRPVMSWTIACAICGEPQIETRCAHDPSFVDDIAISHVLAEAEDLLAS